MKDFLGNALEVGDNVAMLPTMYKINLPIGKVIENNSKLIQVEYINSYNGYSIINRYRSPSHLLIKIPLTS